MQNVFFYKIANVMLLCGLSGIVGTIADCRGEGCGLESLAVHNYGRSLAALIPRLVRVPPPSVPPRSSRYPKKTEKFYKVPPRI